MLWDRIQHQRDLANAHHFTKEGVGVKVRCSLPNSRSEVRVRATRSWRNVHFPTKCSTHKVFAPPRKPTGAQGARGIATRVTVGASGATAPRLSILYAQLLSSYFAQDSQAGIGNIRCVEGVYRIRIPIRSSKGDPGTVTRLLGHTYSPNVDSTM